MAIVPWLSIDGQDANKVPYSEKFYFQNTSAPATFIGDITAWMTALQGVYDAVTQEQILNVWLHLPFTLAGGLKATPTAGSNNEVGALEKFSTALSGEPYSYWFPAWITAGYQAAHPNIVDTAQAAVLAFNNFLLTPSNNTAVSDEDGNILTGTAPSRATKSIRKQRRALGRAR